MAKINFRIILAAIIVISFSLRVSAQQNFTFSGNISGVPAGARLFMEYLVNGKLKRDSCILQNGAFTIKGKVNNPEIAFLHIFTGPYKYINDNEPNASSFFLEPADITANGNYNHFKNINITGSASQIEYQTYADLISAYENKNKLLYNKMMDLMSQRTAIRKENAADVRLKQIRNDIDSLWTLYNKGRNKITLQYINQNPQSYISAFELSVLKEKCSLAEVTQYFIAFTAKVKQSEYGKEIKTYIDTKGDNALGHKAKDFTATSLDGKNISLAALKGKYVLLDFWASWCVPCRAGTPHLIELYNKYHDKDLEVIAVSDNDKDPKAWKEAIKKDNSALWINVLRGMEEDDRYNNINDKFGVSVLPTKVLIDKNGIIIGRYAGTEDAGELDKKLNEIFH